MTIAPIGRIRTFLDTLKILAPPKTAAYIKMVILKYSFTIDSR
jgi:hypothetical protein